MHVGPRKSPLALHLAPGSLARSASRVTCSGVRCKYVARRWTSKSSSLMRDSVVHWRLVGQRILKRRTIVPGEIRGGKVTLTHTPKSPQSAPGLRDRQRPISPCVLAMSAWRFAMHVCTSLSTAGTDCRRRGSFSVSRIARQLVRQTAHKPAGHGGLARCRTSFLAHRAFACGNCCRRPTSWEPTTSSCRLAPPIRARAARAICLPH